MSKIIKLTQEHLDEIRKEFDEMLKGVKLSDGKISYTKALGYVDRKAKLYFTERAYMKMLALVREFDKEVAWHGLARRGDDPEKNEYIIYDILVYPQEVTGGTVNTDQVEYQMWMYSHDDETFQHIRMQGHSHVNMPTHPSAVDTAWYDEILSQLDDTMFYIFFILNKRNEKTIRIYDFAKNLQFETQDVEIEIIEDDTGIEAFLRDAKKMVQEKKYTATTSTQKAPAKDKVESVQSGQCLTVSQTPNTDKPANIVVSIANAVSEKKDVVAQKEEVKPITGKKKKKRKKGIIGFRSASTYNNPYYDDGYPLWDPRGRY